MTVEMKPFTKHDWYGYAGAENFADGSEPLIAEVGTVALVVADGNGLGVEFLDEATGMGINFFRAGGAHWSPEAAKQQGKRVIDLVEGCAQYVAEQRLMLDGFERLLG